MATTIYGAIPWEFKTKDANYNTDLIGKNSEAFTSNDPITNASGLLTVAGTTNTVIGVVAKTATMTSTNAGTSGARVAPLYTPTDETTQFLMGTNADLTGNATDGGTYYKLTANTTNTVQVDVTNGVQTTTARVVMIKKVDPFNEGGTGAGSGLRKCIVVFVRKPTWIDQ